MTNTNTTHIIRTTCEECGSRIILTTIDDLHDPLTLIGDECTCGYWVSRYLNPREARKAGLT